MIPKINKILYTTDLTENSAYVFRYAMSSAEKHDATVDVVFALEPLRPIVELEQFSKAHVERLDGEKKDLIERVKTRIREFAEKELKDKPDLINRISSIRVIEGSPASVILQAVDDLKPDILIMGTHGKGIIAQTFLGSVAHKVLQRSRIPVYVIPIPKA